MLSLSPTALLLSLTHKTYSYFQEPWLIPLTPTALLLSLIHKTYSYFLEPWLIRFHLNIDIGNCKWYVQILDNTWASQVFMVQYSQNVT